MKIIEKNRIKYSLFTHISETKNFLRIIMKLCMLLYGQVTNIQMMKRKRGKLKRDTFLHKKQKKKKT